MNKKELYPAIGAAIEVRNIIYPGVNSRLIIHTHGSCEVGLGAVECAGLRQLFVDTDHRRQRIGTVLIEKAFAVAAEAGKSVLSFTVSRRDAKARAFYDFHGAIVFHEDETDWWMGIPL